MLMMWTLTCWRGLLLIANSIDSGNLEIISMHKEGDGAQKLELLKHPDENVLHELMSNIRLGWMSALCLQGVLGSSWKQTVCWSCKWISLCF